MKKSDKLFQSEGYTFQYFDEGAIFCLETGTKFDTGVISDEEWKLLFASHLMVAFRIRGEISFLFHRVDNKPAIILSNGETRFYRFGELC